MNFSSTHPASFKICQMQLLQNDSNNQISSLLHKLSPLYHFWPVFNSIIFSGQFFGRICWILAAFGKDFKWMPINILQNYQHQDLKLFKFSKVSKTQDLPSNQFKGLSLILSNHIFDIQKDSSNSLSDDSNIGHLRRICQRVKDAKRINLVIRR